MTTFWQSLVEQQQTLSSNANIKSASLFMPLTQLGILKIAGDDNENFLQNLLTNDISALAINQSQLSGFCNAQGRLFAIFLLIRRKDHYQIILPKSMCALLQQRFTMYVLRSKVTITDQTDEQICVGLTQPRDNQIESLNLSNTIYQGHENNNHLSIKLPSNLNRWLYIAPQEQADQLCETLIEQQWQLDSDSVWNLLDIEAGLPMIFPESKEKFTPQQINLDLVNGVSFNKGCYPGQEIVARLHYLGKPSRRMFLAEAQTNIIPDVATEVTTEDGNVAGHVVCAQHKGNSTLKMLLSLKLTKEESKVFLDQTTPIDVISQTITE
jgi:tRNA-modifying protein YgfZ